MGHDEKAVGLSRVNFIRLEEKISEATDPAGDSGRLKISGAKLYIDDGTNWDLVTSA